MKYDKSVVAVGQLFGHRGFKSDEAIGFKLFHMREDCSPDFYGENLYVYMDALKALLAGTVKEIPFHYGKPYKKDVVEQSVEVPVAFSKKGK